MHIINLKTDQLIPYVNNPRHNESTVIEDRHDIKGMSKAELQQLTEK